MTFQPTLPLRGATRQQSTMPPSGAFQPTLPLRGATHARTRCTRRRSSFNPRSPCGERPDPARVALQVPDVSTHAPLAGSDVQVVDGAARRNLVSTHAPLAGSDCSAASCSQRPTSFNPRSPCGERPNLWFWQIALHTVSTHAPLAGSDGVPRRHCREGACFNPRSPCGERRSPPRRSRRCRGFNPRSPCGERP